MFEVIYKCRLCGEIFSERKVDKENAKFISVSLTISKYEKDRESGFSICKLESHRCKDGSFGMADLQGFKKTED